MMLIVFVAIIGSYIVMSLIAVHIIGHLMRTERLEFDTQYAMGQKEAQKEARISAIISACFWPVTVFWLLKPAFYWALYRGYEWKPKPKAPSKTYPSCVCNGGEEPCPPRPPQQGPFR